MSTENGTKPQTDYSDLVISITKSTPLPPEREKWSAVSVIASTPSGGSSLHEEGQLFDLSQNPDLSSYLSSSEADELPQVSGQIRLFHNTDMQTALNHAKAWGDTIIFLSSASTAWLAYTGPKPDLSDNIVWLTCASTDPSAEFKTFAGRANQGVMLDAEREGKLVYAIMELLSLQGRIRNTHQINNSNFSGFVTEGEAKMAEDDGLSYWFVSRQLVWPDGLFVGKMGAYAVYWDRIVSFHIKQNIAAFIQRGRTFNDVELLSNVISSTLGQFTAQMNSEITSFTMPTLAQLSKLDRSKGALQPIDITIELNNEIRRIGVHIGGA